MISALRVQFQLLATYICYKKMDFLVSGIHDNKCNENVIVYTSDNRSRVQGLMLFRCTFNGLKNFLTVLFNH